MNRFEGYGVLTPNPTIYTEFLWAYCICILFVTFITTVLHCGSMNMCVVVLKIFLWLMKEMTWKLEKKSFRWKYIESLEAPRVVHVRTTDMMSKENVYAQVTVRLLTRQVCVIRVLCSLYTICTCYSCTFSFFRLEKINSLTSVTTCVT